MAFKNIFGSIYAVVENIHYNGPRRQLSFDLVQYTNSRKEVETGRMHYQVKGDLTTFEVESVITSVPSGIEHEAMPDDFDFDLFDSFKPYLIGNSPDAALADSDRVGYCYVCEHKPAKSEATGEWPNHSEEYTEEVDNPTYDENEAVSESNPKKITETKTRKVYDKIKYEWNSAYRSTSNIYLDKAGKYWEVTGQPGSHTVTEISAPFLSADWDTWFSATSMDAKDKNISSQIYNWLKTRDEYSGATKV
jgi:hypothetical protein|tara:strand:- start:397 stop:1143 length:747 start_codon:yes stop_codon:yes gene_type:complete